MTIGVAENVLKKVYHLILSCRPLRKKSMWVAFLILLQSLLDFIGIGGIISLLYVLIKSEDQGIIRAFFIGVVLLIITKNIVKIWIDTYCFKWFLSIYRLFSANLLKAYYNRGLLYIKARGSITLTHEVNSVCYTFAMNVLLPFFQMIGKSILVFLLCVAFCIYSPLLALVFLLGVVLIIWFYIRIIRNRIMQYGKEENLAKKKQWRNVQELFWGYKEIETNQAFDLLNNRFNEGMEHISYYRKKVKQVQQIPSALLETGMTFMLLALFLLTHNNHELILFLGAFTIVGMRMIPSIQAIISCWTQLRNSEYTIDIVAEAIDSSTHIVSEEKSKELTFQKSLVAEGISFAYQKTGSMILDNFSMQIDCGQFVGIQGLSGAGKSTFINLLSGFIQPDKGQILIDGVPLSHANMKEWHRMIGYVPQDIFIMDGTIAENIALGVKREDIDSERINTILMQLNLDQWIDTLPSGIDTLIGENGSLISGGEKQRIGIGRALYKSASVLFFDEATSALDSKTEEEILHVICKLPEMGYKVTILMIAHRESSLTKCDRIVRI